MIDVVPWLILVPMTTALILFFQVPSLFRRALVVLSPFVSLALAGVLWLDVLQSGPQKIPLGGWAAPLGIEMYVDGLSVLFVALAALVLAGCSVYAASYFESEREARSFGPLWFLLATALYGLFLSSDIFNIYVFLELLGLSSVALVTLAKRTGALSAALRYLLASLLGSMFYLIGVAILYATYGQLDLQLLREFLVANPASWAAAAFLTGGLMLKSALFPLHFWLPPAHANAPAPVSAVLSALVIKATFFVLIRMWFGSFEALGGADIGVLLGFFGGGAILWGSYQALRQERLKMIVAYSTVAQIGYLFLMFPLLMVSGIEPAAAVWRADAWKGGIYLALSHGVAKASMFLAAGVVTFALGSDRVTGLRGITRCLPKTTIALGLAGISLVGLPPSGGFVGKWYLLSAAIHSGQWPIAVLLIAGGFLAAAYVFRILWYAFLEEGETANDFNVNRPPRVMVFSALFLAVTSLLLGLRATDLLAVLQIGAPFPLLPIVPEGE